MGGERRGLGCIRNIEYCALPSQERFHQSTAKFKGYSGPIGSGKSQALCQEAIKLSYLNAGRTGLLGAPTYPMLRDATQTALLEVLDANRIPYTHNKAEGCLALKDTGSRILLRSVDDYERLRGTNLAWFGLDELTYTPEEAWLRLQGRLRDPHGKRLCGFAVWTPKGHDWVYRRFVAEQAEGYEVILAKPYENRFVLEKVPDFYERLRHSYDEVFFRQEVEGQYVNSRAGLVYHAFDCRTHVTELAQRREATLLWALDFNVTPMCSVVAQLDGERVEVLDEIVLDDASTDQACREFTKRFGQPRSGLVIYGDASGEQRRTTGSTDFQIVRRHFQDLAAERVSYRVPRKNPSVRDRVTLVNSKLRTAAGTVALRVDPRCKGLIRDFEEVVYRPGTAEIDKDRDFRRTHLSDALGYLIWQEFHHRNTPWGEQTRRLF